MTGPDSSVDRRGPSSVRSSRPRRPRAGLVALVALLAVLAWEAAGHLSDAIPVTPARFVRGAWRLALEDGLAPPPPTEQDLQSSPYRALPYVVYGLKPHHVWGETRNLRMTTNAHGFRGPDEIVMPKPEGRYRIVCLGGSTTFGHSVSDEDAYPLRMQQLLREARPDLDLDVVNAGVPSYTSAESLANLVFRCLELEPDALVLYEGINDWRPRVYRNFDNAYFHYRKPWNGTLDGWEWGEGELRGGINPFIQHDTPADNGPAAPNAAAAGTWAFRRNLEVMCAVARARGIRVVLVSNAVHDGNPREFLDGMAEHNRVVRETAESAGALFVDLDAEFPKGGTLRKDSLFVDGVHLGADGSLHKARILARELLRRLLP